MNSTATEYVRADFNDWQAGEKSYDLVLCLNALHHLYDPVGALRKMMHIARDRIVLEIATVTSRDLIRSSRGWPVFGATRAPLIVLNRRGPIDTAADRTFLFTRTAIARIFNDHSQAFELLQFSPSPHRGQMIVEARRRRIDHLVVVAGVACVGKSRFIERLLTSAELRTRFGIGEGNIETVNAYKVHGLPSREFQTLLLHYDILRPQGRHLLCHSRDPVFHLLGCARKLTVITLTQSRSIIVERSISNKQPSRRRRELANHYDEEQFLRLWHEAWFDAIAPFIKRNASRIALADDDYTEVSRDAISELLE